MNRPLTPRFQPRLEALEDRCTPSTLALPSVASAEAALVAQKSDTHAGNWKGGGTGTTTPQGGVDVDTFSGKSSHLGRFTGEGFHVLNPADFTFAGQATWTAANGDTLEVTYAGQVFPSGDPDFPFGFTAELVAEGGTGRLANASGSATMTGGFTGVPGELYFDFQGNLHPQGLRHVAPAGKALVAGQSDTHTVPFKVTGGGPAPAGVPLFPGGTVPHSATGNATHVGKYTGDGSFTLGSLAISPTGAVSGTFQGSYVFVAANGDKLAFKYGTGFTGKVTGQISADGTTVENVKFDAVFTLDPANSTGRFKKYTGGSFRMIALADSISLISGVPGFTAPFNYTWSGEGWLEFKSGKK